MDEIIYDYLKSHFNNIETYCGDDTINYIIKAADNTNLIIITLKHNYIAISPSMPLLTKQLVYGIILQGKHCQIDLNNPNSIELMHIGISTIYDAYSDYLKRIHNNGASDTLFIPTI